MQPLSEELFKNHDKQNPIITSVMDSHEKYGITIKSYQYLTEEQLDTIVAVVEADIAKRAKLFDIELDVSEYTGFCDVDVSQTPKGLEVIID